MLLETRISNFMIMILTIMKSRICPGDKQYELIVTQQEYMCLGMLDIRIRFAAAIRIF